MTPRDKLQKRGDFKNLALMLNSPEMDLCCEVAMLTVIENLPSGQDLQAATAAHFRLDGSKIFLRTLRGLANLAPERRPDTTGQLNHSA